MGRDGRGVKPASSTSIEITFQYQGARCRERIKLEPTPANLKRVERHRAAILDAIENGTFDYAVTFPESTALSKFKSPPSSLALFSSYCAAFVERQRVHVKYSTWKKIDMDARNILIPSFGEMHLADIRRKDIRDWCASQTCGNKRINNVLSILRRLFDEAVMDEVVDVNPLAGWRYERKSAVKRTDDIDPFTVSEQGAILDAAEGQFRNFIKFALWTGMRTSEMIALDWADVDFKRGVVRVSKALTQGSSESEEPKTRRSEREVKLLPPAMEALVAQKRFTQLKQSEIFQDPYTGQRWRGDQPIRKDWVAVLEKAQVRYRRPYQTRHTYASMMLSSGEPPTWVASQMGHADLGMLFRVYGRWLPDAAPEAGKLAVKRFG